MTWSQPISIEQFKLFYWYLQLFAEILLHLVTGRVWFFSAIKMFFSSHKNIQKARLNFNNLASDTYKIASVNEVANKILISLNNKAIKAL